MKLYSWIRNERGNNKTQGGNKILDVFLDYEGDSQDWRCNDFDHGLQILYRLVGDKPVITIRGNKDFTIEDKR